MINGLRTALILGGGGPVGIAWEAGLILGLRDAGVDLARVDRIAGTSAGAIVGASLAVLGSVDELYRTQSIPLEDTGEPPPTFNKLLAAFTWARILHRGVEAQRRSIAKSALKLNLPGEASWREQIAANLPLDRGWPDRELLITAVDCETGELELWTREAGVPLALAVAASCAVPCVFPLVHVNGRLYMDGGIGSSNNAALARGYDLALIFAPTERLFGRNSTLPAELGALRAQGTEVVTFAFDDETAKLSGNLMAVSRRGEIAELGRRQARAAVAANPSLQRLSAGG